MRDAPTRGRRTPAVCAVLILIAVAGAARSSEPQPAAPAVLFTPRDERSAVFTADGNTVYFSVRVGERSMQALCTADRRDGRWSEPQVLPFSGLGFDADPYLTASGQTLYFASTRTSEGKSKPDLDLWMVERDGAGWGTPVPVPGKVNSPAHEAAPVIASSGRLYFVSTRSGDGDLFVAAPDSAGFGTPVSLGPGVNTATRESCPALSPDEHTLVFMAIQRPDEKLTPGPEYLRGDLFVSRFENGVWAPARHLGPQFNTPAMESSPVFSADGKRLYFMSERGFATDPQVRLTATVLARGLASPLNGRGNIYEVDASALEDTP